VAQHRTQMSAVDAALNRDKLNLPQVASLLVAGIAPMLVAAAIVTTAFGVTGQTEIPAAFLVVGVVLTVFAVGYVAMAEKVNNQGAFVALIARGLGRPWGIAAGAVAVVAYSQLLFGAFGGFGDGAATGAAQWFGWTANWYWYALAIWAVVTFLGLRHITLTGTVTVILGGAELVLVCVFTASGLMHPAGGTVSFHALNPTSLLPIFVTLGALWATTGLGSVGFELSPVFSEDARHRARTNVVATFGVLIMSTLIYAGSSWAMTVHYGEKNVADIAAQNGPATLFAMAGQTLANFGQVLLLTSFFGTMLTFHNAAARYLFSLGRDGILPKVFGRLNHHGAPWAGSLLLSGVGLAVIIAYALSGLNPLTQLLFWLGTAGGLGVFLLLTTTSLAVIVFFAKGGNRSIGSAPGKPVYPGTPTWRIHRVGVFRAFVFPTLSLLALGFMVVQILHNFPLLLGPEPTAFARKLPWLYAVATLGGLAWTGYLYATRRSVYQRIGRDASQPDLTIPPPAEPAPAFVGRH
jgi:amino acid transporter